MVTGLQILKDLEKARTKTEVITYRPKKKKIDITTLTREDFSYDRKLQDKYFRHNNKELDRLHLPEISKEEYASIASIHFKSPKTDEKNKHLDTASKYYIKKAKIIQLANDLQVSTRELDSSNYIWDEDYYIHYNFNINIAMADDLFRERGTDNRYASAYTVYIHQEPKTKMLDLELWNELYAFCYKAMLSRKAMLLSKVPQCLSFLISVLEYSNGFSENVTSVQMSTMQSYKKFFKELLENKEASEFIKSTNDIKMFGDTELTHSDYIETYRKLLRRMYKCTGNELEQFRREMSFIEDPYIDEILAKEIDFEDALLESYIKA